jgi:ribosomal protein S13
MIAGLRQSGPSFQPYTGTPNRARSESSPANVSYERSIVASAQSHTDAALSITTDEGDSVTISFAQDSNATYGSLVRGQRGPNGSSQTSVRYASLETSSQFEIQVQGDLSEQEMKDIQDLVKRVGQALRSFVKGDVEKAASKLSKAGDLGSLSGFQVEMNHSESVSVAIAARRTIGPVPVAPAPLEEGTIDKPRAVPVPVGAPPLDPAMLDEKPLPTTLPVSQPNVDDLAEQLLDISKTTNQSLDRLQRAVAHAFKGLRQEHGMREHGQKLDSLEHALKERLEKSAAA